MYMIGDLVQLRDGSEWVIKNISNGTYKIQKQFTNEVRDWSTDVFEEYSPFILKFADPIRKGLHLCTTNTNT